MKIVEFDVKALTIDHIWSISYGAVTKGLRGGGGAKRFGPTIFQFCSAGAPPRN